jgi:ADP-ribose pyrophosphatase YjhB (NUDIX family)
MALKLLRTIRLDASDTFVFERASAPGEWAVPGAFVFWNCDPATLTGRARQAFRSGFLGLASFGHSTLAVVSEASADERAEAVAQLAAHLVAEHGAPSLADARLAAEDEISFAQSLADHPVGMLVALHRSVKPDGAIAEQFRTLQMADAKESARMPCSSGAFAIVEEAESAVAGPADAGDEVDLAALLTADRRPPP